MFCVLCVSWNLVSTHLAAVQGEGLVCHLGSNMDKIKIKVSTSKENTYSK